MIYLRYNDFYINHAGNLCINQNGFSFVMFVSNDCVYCSELAPSFLRLSQIIKGCIFGTVNVDNDSRKIVEISTRSKTPLEYVPYLVLYANGIPIAQYHSDESNPDANFEKMRVFLLTQTSQSKDKSIAPNPFGSNNGGGGGGGFVNSRSSQQSPDFVIPAYSIAIPHNAGSIRSKRVCYLGYENAYGKK